MHKRRLKAPSPALVVSSIALFVALGGTTYAATSLPRNSVGAKQLKKNAVISQKIKNRAVTAAKINTKGLTVPNARHATSATSATSATNATHATSADSATTSADATNAANLGGHPASFYSAATLQSGQSESGVFGMGGPAASSNEFYTDGVTFPIPLAHALDASHVVPVAQGTAPQPHCPGQGQADPGYLCVYSEVSIFMDIQSNGISLPDQQMIGAAPTGFVLFGQTTAVSGAASISGTWTVSGG